jgi:choline dehydrogenase
MGGENEPLDPACRVRGTEGLRVVDCSSFPTIPGGNTNAPAIALAERAADLILGRDPLPAFDPGMAELRNGGIAGARVPA